MGTPTDVDREKARMWQHAIDNSADMWTMLAPHQQDMIRARIAWATQDPSLHDSTGTAPVT